MKKAILATKVGMTQIFNDDGQLIPVTVLQAGPCTVTQVKTEENDGYAAVQVGFGEIREKLVNKPEKGHFAKAGVEVSVNSVLLFLGHVSPLSLLVDKVLSAGIIVTSWIFSLLGVLACQRLAL